MKVLIKILAFSLFTYGISPVAKAQESNSSEINDDSESPRLVVEEVFVTGSLLPKGDFVSKAPIATISSTQFEMSNTTNVEALINSMPQVVGGADKSSTFGQGIATANLRGLGQNRTLVLINSRRFVPTFPDGGTVDLNFIPVGLIDRVEVLTGGASAAYGSDALAGVINFILKDDIEGWEFNAGGETSDKGDSEIYNINVTNGGTFSGGKGRYMLHLDYLERKPITYLDRELTDNSLADGISPSGNLMLVPARPKLVVSDNLQAWLPVIGGNTGFQFTDDGSWSTLSAESATNFAEGSSFLQLPQERESIKANIEYDFGSAQVYADIYYSKSEVPTIQGAPFIGWPSQAGYRSSIENNPFLTDSTKQVLSMFGNFPFFSPIDANSNGIVDSLQYPIFQRAVYEIGDTFIERSFESVQFEFGVKGELNENWGYEIFAQLGEVESILNPSVLLNPSRIQQALLIDEDGNCTDPSDGCIPINLYHSNLSQEELSFIQYPKNAGLSVTNNKQNVVMGSLSGNTGDWFSIPGDPGPIGLVVGFEYLEIKANVDTPFLIEEQRYEGWGEAPFSLDASVDSSSVFAEAVIPLVSGKTGIDFLELELGIRSSDHDSTGRANTYKAAISYYPNPDFQVRASYNKAMRSPAINELYQRRSQGWPIVDDPCTDGRPLKEVGAGSLTVPESVWSHAIEPTPELAAACIATGVPEQNLYNPMYREFNGITTDFGGQSSLESEDAKTFSFGIVWTPYLIDGLSVSADYFRVEIENYIALSPVQPYQLMQACYESALGQGGPGSVACNAIERDSDGRLQSMFVGYENLGLHELAGWDLNLSYGVELFSGYLDLNYFATKIITRTIEDDSFGQIKYECKGIFNGDCDNIIDYPVPDFKHRMTANWSRDKLDLQLVWKHISSLEDGNSYTVFHTEKLDSYSIFDLSGRYAINDSWSITLGVKNLFDEEPQPIGSNSWEDRNTRIGVSTNTYTQFYDVIGRTAFLKLSSVF